MMRCRYADHLLLSLRSDNHLLLENVPNVDICNELAEGVLSDWPHGVRSHLFERGKWKVEFNGSPWACFGLDFIMYESGSILCPPSR